MESSITGLQGICLLWRIKMGSFKFGLKLESGSVAKDIIISDCEGDLKTSITDDL